jgi:hypothetical protein
MTGNFLLTEDLLQTLFRARATALKPGGVLVPSAAAMEAVPVSAPGVHEKEIASWSLTQHGVDLNAARTYAANTVHYRVEGLREVQYLAEPSILHTLDLHNDHDTRLHAEVMHEITESGLCHGWVGWFKMKLGDSWLSTSPRSDQLHWSPAFLPLDPPLAMEKGERVDFAIDRAPYGDWTWRVRANSGSRRHSTFFSSPMKAATLKKAALDYRPTLNADGRAVAFVLSQCDGSTAAKAIAQAVVEHFPERYHSSDEALRFVQGIIKNHA